MTEVLRAPFPWYGGKSRAADLIWERFGNVPNYVEPFAGSLAVLLMRPHEPKIETVNDLDAHLANFWRSIRQDPEAVATAADWPVNEVDLHARHTRLVEQIPETRERMMTDPDWCDPERAGRWVWGLSQWIGGGWCAERERVERKRPTMDLGRCVTSVNVVRKRPCSGGGRRLNARTVDTSKIPDLHGERGINKTRLIHLGNGGRGVNKALDATGHPHEVNAGDIYEWFAVLAERLRRVRVCCGDWLRVLGKSVLDFDGGRPCAILLDPPYGDEKRQANLYASDSMDVAGAVREWALEHGDDPNLRIALCGYEGEHTMPGWDCVPWKARGGYSHGKNGNQHRERVWFSPHCVKATQLGLFGKVGT